jgi:hypothetical protein
MPHRSSSISPPPILPFPLVGEGTFTYPCEQRERGNRHPAPCRSAAYRIFLEQGGGPFGDHDRRRIRGPADNGGHDGSVGDA